MPFLDVSDVLLDPEFNDDSMVCHRKDQTIGANGRASNAGTTTPFNGVVTMESSKKLTRGSDGAVVAGSITIHTQFRLVSGEGGRDADVVTWDGADYTVARTDNYSRYGNGFIAAYCELLPLSG